jgi:anaerobic magnesium-protoporphyrin IX monomethyl ester cyclase
MKIAISYPPLTSKKGTPLLSQNRQFQWFNSPTYIFPVIPAYAASLLAQNGHQIFWDDGIAEELSYDQWEKRLFEQKPDLIAIETKTPVIKRHWQIINELKVKSPKLKIVLMGDHVTALSEESLLNSQADFVLQGGDYDFILLNLVNHLESKEELKGGIWYRQNNEIKNSGLYSLRDNFLDDLPMIDRELTKWRLYAYKNGNFKYTPGSYMMSARDCWWGRCTFCSWTTMFPGNSYRSRSAAKALDEVGLLIDLGVKEIMEDSGTLPIGEWLQDFCQGMIERGYNKKVKIDCNMRLNAISDLKTWQLMKKAGFRLVLFGLESANQKTLKRINKNLRIDEIEKNLKLCKQAGLEPHITAMVGYPWENKADAQKTIDLAKNLFRKGYVDTLQATIVIPYPGTPLYKYCQENNLLNFTDYERFDQREQVMKSDLTTEEVKKMTQDLYKSFLSPIFILKKIISIRSLAQLKFLYNAGSKVLAHLNDFK